jgi:hypothetical protein
MKTLTIAKRTAPGGLAQAGPIVDDDAPEGRHRIDADSGSPREAT